MDVGKSQRVPHFRFFRHCEIFFPKIKIFPLQFFDVLRQNPCNCDKSFFSALWDFFPKMKIFVFNFFMFCDRMDFEKSQSPLSVFRYCETLARQGLAQASPGAPFGPFFWVCVFFEKFLSVKFSIFEYCKREYLTLGSLFAIFEPRIWRRLGRSRLVRIQNEKCVQTLFNPLSLKMLEYLHEPTAKFCLKIPLFRYCAVKILRQLCDQNYSTVITKSSPGRL